MADWGASGRVDSYEFRLVDPFTLQETGETVSTIEGESQLSFNYYGDNIATGTIVTDADDIGKLVRVYHTASVGGEEATEVLGTVFADSSTATAKHRSVRTLPSLRDEASRTHTVDIWFEIGTNKGEALRTICGWCGWELGVDPYGYVTVGAYTAPQDKAISYEFEDGESCTYAAGYDFSNTNAKAVNRCIAYFSRTSKQDDPDKDNYDPWPLSDSTFVDLPERSPFSYQRTGRHRTYVLKVGDACSHDDLVAQAQRYLDENSGAYYSFQIEHAGIPGLWVGDVVRYVNRRDGSKDIDLRLQVAEMQMTLGPGCMCKTTLREVD